MRKLLVAALALLTLLSSVGDVDARRRRRRRRRRGHGYLQLNSTTTGADVLIDGNKVGTVPLPDRLRLRTGKHTLKLTKKGFTQYLDVFQVRRRQTTKLEIDLLPVAAIFVIRANEADARVYIDGKFVGTTPLETEALIGKRAIRVRKAGFYDVLLEKKATAGQTINIEAELKPLPVGTTPYRPPPPPPPKWYEKWYVWAGIAGGVAAVAVTVTLSVTLATKDPIEDFGAQYKWKTQALRRVPLGFTFR
ncbi:MAG: PEGA domain-containing protein [Myxococcales bacterium]|nr:PEGA domain-containing protein [Myxococcales bacterium]